MWKSAEETLERSKVHLWRLSLAYLSVISSTCRIPPPSHSVYTVVHKSSPFLFPFAFSSFHSALKNNNRFGCRRGDFFVFPQCDEQCTRSSQFLIETPIDYSDTSSVLHSAASSAEEHLLSGRSADPRTLTTTIPAVMDTLQVCAQ